MPSLLRVRLALAVLATMIFVADAAAQTYPTKPVRIIVAFAPGGPADVMARLIAQRIFLRSSRMNA